MTVVISEFEVVPEPERQAVVQDQDSRSRDASASPPAAEDVAKVARLLAERALRVWAD
ncbi:MAG: hypothetical protein ACK5YW_10065 [Betaproteobacteria bacterium]|jgi:hypothetical protein|nr:hypothetical protein [Rhodocyclaceae bacterium]MCA3136069.1 hypothetical protein [Rhodocyclaceae bacterium]MCA3141043.1 hypothetical protein [Rhodocyclaceae bacterium]MCA3146161.1 hypothetical protein [Rhodocyclaceae bacterium]MCE2898294.1 hypothetical protein [Betaproteobacteria bacterium]